MSIETQEIIMKIGQIISTVISLGRILIAMTTPILIIVALILLIKYLRKKNKES